jgi:hypothetical protein
MLLKDKYCPIFLKDFIINKNTANLCSKLIDKTYIPHILVSGPEGCGKYTLTKAILNSLYETNIQSRIKTFKINGKDIEITCSNYHFEILIDKYSNNKTLIYDIIEYLTESKDINNTSYIKIIILRNINYCSKEILSFLKNKIETSGVDYRFFAISNHISPIPNTFRGLFTYIHLKYETKETLQIFFKKNKIPLKKKSSLFDTKNLNNLFVIYEHSIVSSYKTFSDLKENQIIILIKDSINNPDNIIKIREIIYQINIKNIKIYSILRNILYHFLSNKEVTASKKNKICEIFAKYDNRSRISYKAQIHYEALFSELIYCYHS